MEKDLTTSYDTGYIPKQKQTGESSTVLLHKIFLKVLIKSLMSASHLKDTVSFDAYMSSEANSSTAIVR